MDEHLKRAFDKFLFFCEIVLLTTEWGGCFAREKNFGFQNPFYVLLSRRRSQNNEKRAAKSGIYGRG